MHVDFGRLSILFVEDDESIRVSAGEFLQRLFKNVYLAKDGLEAFDIFKNKKPDIIVTDIKMPKIDGLEFAKRVRVLDDDTPIIISTAYTDTEYLLKAIELQLVKYLIKPMNSKTLLEALELSLSKKRVLKLGKYILYDPINKTWFYRNESIVLTKKELMLLELLIKNKGRVCTYDEIENYLWGYEGMSKDALRTLIRKIRKKLKEDIITNISGIGYKMDTEDK